MEDQCHTESENLFEKLCEQQGVNYTRLPELQDRKQPDYELNLEGQRVVFEVKQIEPNEDDKDFTDNLKHGNFAFQCRNPDNMAKRVRKKIIKSRSQFISYLRQHPKTPAVLVLFDYANNKYTDIHSIHTAMHGFEQVSINTAGQSPTIVERGFARRNNKEIREDKNQQLSALATLHECCDIHTRECFLSLCFYHNKFADHPFDPAWWHGEHITHMIIGEKTPGQFQNWVSHLPSA